MRCSKSSAARLSALGPLVLSAVMISGACAGEVPSRRLTDAAGGESLVLLDQGSGDGAPRDVGPPADGPSTDGAPPPADSKPPPADSKPPPLDGSGGYTGKPGEFTQTFNGRSYKLFVPAGYKASAAIAVIVGFHGSGDTMANFYNFIGFSGFKSAAAPANFILIVPETKAPSNDWPVWGSGSVSGDIPKMKTEMADVLQLVADVGKRYRIDDKQIHAFGFSNGGVFTAIAGMAHTDKLASLTVAGYGWGANYPLVTPARKIATELLCGTNDSFHSMAQASEGYLKGQGHPTRFLSVSGVGHKLSGLLQAHSPSSLFAWMKQHPKP